VGHPNGRSLSPTHKQTSLHLMEPASGVVLKCDFVRVVAILSRIFLTFLQCDQTFSKRDHKKRHERSRTHSPGPVPIAWGDTHLADISTDTNSKPYACTICDRHYARSSVRSLFPF
jgi:hypothetical protein